MEAVKWFQEHWDVNAADFPTKLNCRGGTKRSSAGITLTISRS
jgi:hypothetical protein